MTKEKILEGNKLIAEFLGYAYIPYTGGHSGRPCGWIIKNYKLVDRKVPKLFLGKTTKDLLYHKSWDWLKPVIDKISDLTDEGKYLVTLSIFNFTIFANITDTWYAVVEFIEWYNEKCSK